ncbi:TPA: Lar family restriction alleviation protein [Raoultella ornithinolytica]|nr:Lar family restriction alleviation protein [Raoultella ornithinolytica]HEC2619592.1 Lar family restriction alleviation protein [Raoultella ornithinolytica]
MSFEKLLPCPFCGGEPEEDGGTFVEYYGHERQDYLITCKQCGAEVYCSVGTFERADVPCSCHHDTRKVCVDKWNKRAAIIQAANSPVIPDGYVMVPKEPTERMVIDGFESEPDETFSEPEVWEVYQKMSGCKQAAFRARLCWAAMITAAPQEVEGE